MPLTGSYKPAPLPSANQPENVSPVRKWLAGGTRVLSGWGASIPAMEPGLGSVIGATIAGGGEALAEKIEGSPLNEARIALEAGLGAVPLSRVFKAGRAAQSAIRSGALAGTGEAGREYVQGEQLSPGSIATATGLGGLLGGALGKFSGTKAPKPTRKSYTLEQAGGKTKTMYGSPETPPSPSPVSGREGYWKKQGLNPPTAPGRLASAQQQLPFMSEAPDVLPGAKVPYGVPTLPTASASKTSREAFNAEIKASEMQTKSAEKAAKLADEEARLAQIEAAQGDMKAGQPTVSESISAKTPEGVSKRLSTRYKAAGEEGGGEGTLSQLGKMISGGRSAAPAVQAAPLEASAQALAPEAPTAVAGSVVEDSPMARLFKSRVDAAGQGYRDIKAAIGAGEKVPAEGRTIAGKALRQEGQAVGNPMTSPRGVLPVQPVPPGPSAPVPITPHDPLRGPVSNRGNQMEVGAQGELFPGPKEWGQVTELENVVKELQGQGKSPEDIQKILPTFYKRISEAGGEVDPEFLARIGMTGVGALTGGIVGGAVGHPFAGMAIGAVGGALSPSAIKSGLDALGAHPMATDNLAEKIATPEGVKATANTIMSTLPQVQRFNYLMDTFGLPANALFGPYGSAMMAGIEAHLSGDPRGMELLKKLTPERFLQEWSMAEGEAKSLIQHGELGRAESAMVGSGKASEVLQWPGVMMTAGDVAARKISEEAGFLTNEARRFTLTSEPETKFFHNLANLSKGSPMMQMVQPFARTPANIAEQGLQRTPGLGFLMQAARETPDPLRQQLVQQGLGAGAAGAGYLLGDNIDPETGRIVKRFATNLGGQYSGLVGAGFAAGEAHRAGRDLTPAAFTAGLSEALPLPTTQPITDIYKAFKQGDAPRGAIPAALYRLLYPPQTAANATKLPRMGRMPRLGSPTQ